MTTTRAAGILFKKDGLALFLKRAEGGDFAGYWGLPGGGIEGDETPEQTATREAVEELGVLPPGKRTLLARSNVNHQAPAPVGADVAPGAELALPGSGATDFTTFVQEVKDTFEPTLNQESTGFAWAPVTSPPEPLHPGVRIVLDRLAMDELGVARAMSAGLLTSPQKYMNVTLWNMRVTGTGVAYRRAVVDAKGNEIREEEFPWRDPAFYLNDDFLARCNGLPVIWSHPQRALLNSKEFADRIVGTVMLPYIKGDEVWGIAKVYDDDANLLMQKGLDEGEDYSTSPSVVLSDPNSKSHKFRMEDGSVLLVEGKPSLLDHLAICERGVWDKGGEASGIKNDSVSHPSFESSSFAVTHSQRSDKLDRLKLDMTLLDFKLRNYLSLFR